MESLVHWRKYPGNPILVADAENPDAFDGMWPLSMVWHEGTIYWYYEALGRPWSYTVKGVEKNTRVSQIWLATLDEEAFPYAEQWAETT